MKKTSIYLATTAFILLSAGSLEAQSLTEAEKAARERESALARREMERSAAPSAGANAAAALTSPFWRNTELARAVGLLPEQQKKLEDVFQQYRVKLIEQNAVLSKEEAALSALMAAFQAGDEARAFSQIDKVTAARADLEGTNARMLVSLRGVMTSEQWSRLSSAPGFKK